MARGDVFLVSLPDSDKREEKGNRPAIAVQTDVVNSPMLMIVRLKLRLITVMRSQPIKLTYEIELQAGEALALPPELTASVGAGCWLITIQPISAPTFASLSTPNHAVFLSSYAPEDEGLYDDYTR